MTMVGASVRRRADHAVFEIGGADAEGAGGARAVMMCAFPNVTDVHSPLVVPADAGTE